MLNILKHSAQWAFKLNGLRETDYSELECCSKVWKPHATFSWDASKPPVTLHIPLISENRKQLFTKGTLPKIDIKQ